MRPPEPEALANVLPVRAVVDSCVFPRVRKWLEPIILAAQTDVVVPLWSPLIISESNRLLTWLWLERHGGDLSDAGWRQCSDAAKKWFGRVSHVFQVVDDRPPPEPAWTDRPIDEWDTPIWTAAKRGGAHCIVTENLKDGPPPDANGLQQYEGIFFIHPDNFLRALDYLADFYWSKGFVELEDSPSRRAEPQNNPLETINDSWFRLNPDVRDWLSQLIKRKFGPQF